MRKNLTNSRIRVDSFVCGIHLFVCPSVFNRMVKITLEFALLRCNVQILVVPGLWVKADCTQERHL